MRLKFSEAAKIAGGILEGPDGEADNISGPESANESSITFLFDKNSMDAVNRSAARCVVTDGTAIDGKSIIVVKSSPLAAAQLAQWFYVKKFPPPKAGISKRASVSKKARIDKGAIISDGVVIGHDCVVGSGTILHPNVVCYPHTKIGKNVVVHSGAVIGLDGFGFLPVQGKHVRIPQVGGVRIEDDVEIGANCTIARGRMGDTVIGEGTKIDCMVHIAHNVIIGKHCIILAQVGIAGSARIGNYVMLAGQSGVGDHVTIGDHAIVTGQSGASHSLEGGKVYSGTPAREHFQRLREEAARRKK